MKERIKIVIEDPPGTPWRYRLVSRMLSAWMTWIIADDPARYAIFERQIIERGLARRLKRIDL